MATVRLLSKGTVRAKTIVADSMTVAGHVLDGTNIGATATARTGTQAIDAPSIGAGAIGTITITATGVLATDLVQIESPATLAAGLVVQGFQVTLNTITVKIMNTTAAPIDDTSKTWTWKAIGIA
jgi:hypothetical protein